MGKIENKTNLSQKYLHNFLGD